MKSNSTIVLKPSQWLNFGVFLGCILLGILIIPLLYAIWRFLVIHTWKFLIQDDQIIEKKGVFKIRIESIEMYRIKDIQYVQPFLLRIVRKSTLIIISSDKSTPKTIIPGIPKGIETMKLLRRMVESKRDEKGVIERDFE